MKQLIHVIYIVNGTTKNAWFEADHCSSQILDGSGILEFTNGFQVERRAVSSRDELTQTLQEFRTPITSVQYGTCELIQKFPIKDDDTKPDTK